MRTIWAEIEEADTTGGLASAYQVTQITGATSAAVMDAGGQLRVSVIPLPHRRIAVPRIIVFPETGEDLDPALASFSGPLGQPRTHEERAILFRQNYRPAPEESGYLDIPEDVL